MVRKCAALLLILGLLSPGIVAALGLGELTIKSYLNEPLRAEVDLLEIGGLNEGQVKIRLASREDFDRASVERAHFLTSLKFEVQLIGRDRGTLHINSKLPVREPFLDFLVEVRWPNGRLLREYTVLLDLPVFSGPDSTAVNTSRAPGSSPRDSADETRPGSETAASGRSDRERDYGASAETDPVAGSEYLVPKNETLWGIASRARPEGSTVPQTMLEIQRLNPEAFINNNINRLKAGYVLRLPTSRDITATDRSAEATVAAQMEEWKGKKSEIDTRLLDEPASSRASQDQETSQGRLQIAGGEEIESSITAGDEDEDIVANLEQMDRVARENDDLQARLNAVEEQLDTARRLVELKDDQIAALQTTISTESSKDGSSDVVVGSIGDPETEGTDTEQPGESPPAAQIAEPAPSSSKETSSGQGFSSYLVYIGVGILLLLLLLAYVFRDRFSRDRFSSDKDTTTAAVAGSAALRADDDDEFAGVELGDDGLIIDEFSEIGEEHITDEPVELQSIPDRDDDVYAAQFESGDALAEADIYIAYGRYPQAVDLLKTAIGIDPRNSEYRVKLLEVCVEMVERGEFQQQYADLQVIGDTNALQKGKDLLDGVDNGETWLEDLPAATLTADPSDIATAIEARTQTSLEDDLVLDEDVSLLDEDFEFELDDDAIIDDLSDDAIIDDLSDEDGHISIDLEFEEKSFGGAADADDPAGEAPTKIPSLQAGQYQDPLADLNEFDSENYVPDPDELEVIGLSTAELEDIPELELDAFDIEPLEDDESFFAAADSEHASAQAGEALLTEFGELEIEGDEEGDEEPPTDLVFANDGDEVSTKLDLARAYMDMGDEDGARSILEEVLQDGSDGQQQEATDLLETIS